MSRLPAALAAAALLAAGCIRTHYNAAIDQQETTITSTDREVAIGRKMSKKVEEELGLVEDEAVQ